MRRACINARRTVVKAGVHLQSEVQRRVARVVFTIIAALHVCTIPLSVCVHIIAVSVVGAAEHTSQAHGAQCYAMRR